MRSDARSALHKRFWELPEQTHFQLVNTVVGAALPNSFVLIKIVPVTGYNAIRLDNGDPVRLKLDSLVEVMG